MTRSTPSFDASFTVCSKTMWCDRAIDVCGCSALPWQESALIAMPRRSIASRNARSFDSSRSKWSGLQCALPGYAPVPISTACTPSDTRWSSASSSGRSAKSTAKTPIFMRRAGVGGNGMTTAGKVFRRTVSRKSDGGRVQDLRPADRATIVVVTIVTTEGGCTHDTTPAAA